MSGLTPPRGDPFRGKVMGGARLTKRLVVRPTRIIYEGTDRSQRTQVRVEVFPEPFAGHNSSYIRHVLRQAVMTRQITSRHVVAVLEMGRRSEHLPSTLQRLIEKKGQMGLNRALTIAEDILHALAAVEAIGAIHGNVTPEGVLLDYDGSARLDHLGTALRPQELNRLTLTENGTVAGRALYIAPERACDERQADMRCDLYSLGATMYHLLSGRPPYDGENAQDVMRQHAEAPVPDLAEARPGIPPAICGFIERLMAKDPADRPPGPQAALEELRECAVEMSSKKQIGPVRAGVPKDAQVRRMYLQHREKRLELRKADLTTPPKVLVLIQASDAVAEDPLPPERARAIRAFIAYALSFRPELEVMDWAYPDQLRAAGYATQRIRETAGADYLLVAQHAPGFERRNWTLTFSGGQKTPWSVQTQCTSERDRQDDLSNMADALQTLLERVAARLELPPHAGGISPAGASVSAWSSFADAVQAEREGKWPEAAAAARRAVDAAPGAAPFLVLSAFYSTVAQAKAPGPFSPVPEMRPEDLPPEMAGLATVLTEIRAPGAVAVERRFGEFLSRLPRSARGYFLLGSWRLHVAARPEEAAVSLKHAADLDPDYMPPAFAYVELLARQDPGKVKGFLEGHKERATNKENTYRLSRYAEELLDEAAPVGAPNNPPQ